MGRRRGRQRRSRRGPSTRSARVTVRRGRLPPVERGHLVGAARWTALASSLTAWPHQGTALRGGQGQGNRRTLADDQGGARKGGRSEIVARRGGSAHGGRSWQGSSDEIAATCRSALVSVDLEAEIDDLYVAPLDQFVRRRDALARSLKQAGERPSADRVAGLRKPSLVAWAVNQLARTRRRDVDLLLDAGRRIVDAQQASITKGERASLDAAQSSIRSSDLRVDRIRAGDSRRSCRPSTLTHVAETLRAAATGAEGRELLARGRLTEELSETGWEIVGRPDARARERPQSSLQAPSVGRGPQRAPARASSTNRAYRRCSRRSAGRSAG